MSEGDEGDNDNVPPRKDTVADYKPVFGDMPPSETVLEVTCLVARLMGQICGDNMAEGAKLSDKRAKALAREEYDFVTKNMAALFGVSNTTNMHRLAYHLLDELRLRGNLVEADSSLNDTLQVLCKVTYSRTNKQEDKYELQLLRAEQELAFFVDEMDDKSTKAALSVE